MIKTKLTIIISKFILFLSVITMAFASYAQFSADSIVIPIKNNPNYTKITYEKSYALIIGNDKYLNWDKLKNAVFDSKKIKGALEKQGFQSFIYQDLDYDRTMYEIKNFLIQYGNNENNRLIIWYSGHSYNFDGKGYIVPIDAKLPSDFYSFMQKAIAVQDVINDTINFALKARHVLIVCDSCYDAREFANQNNRAEDLLFSDKIAPERTRFLISSRQQQNTPADNGDFADLFVEALNVLLNEKQTIITAQQIGKYIKDKIPQTTSLKVAFYQPKNDNNQPSGQFLFKLTDNNPIASSNASANNQASNKPNCPKIPKEEWDNKLEIAEIELLISANRNCPEILNAANNRINEIKKAQFVKKQTPAESPWKSYKELLPESQAKYPKQVMDRILSCANNPNCVNLDISRLNLAEVPQIIGHLTKLERINLSINKISEFPSFLYRIPTLKEINLNGNFIENIPDSISSIENLQILDLSNNTIKKISNNIVNLNKLKSLNLSNNQITALPNKFGQLTSLQTLNLKSNNISKMPMEIENMFNLTDCNFSSNELENFSSKLPENIIKLNFENNRFTKIPVAISGLTKLKELNLGKNKIGIIDDFMQNPEELERLEIYENEIITIPKEIGKYTNLKYLNLSKNKIVAIPEIVERLVNLREFQLWGNQIINVNPVVQKLPNLKELILTTNPIQNMPKWLINMKEAGIAKY